MSLVLRPLTPHDFSSVDALLTAAYTPSWICQFLCWLTMMLGVRRSSKWAIYLQKAMNLGTIEA